MASNPQLHMLYTCPFCWKVRGLLEHIGLEHDKIQVNPMKAKKQLPSAPEWTKVPVWVEVDGEVFTDSTPIMKHIDAKYNGGSLWKSEDETRRDKWLEWADLHMSKATIPILYGSMLSALKTTTRVSKLEKFGFISKRLYAWAGFPIMWGIIARSRVKKDGRKPKQLWHDLLSEFTDSFGDAEFFGGKSPDLVDLVAFGYMRSVSPYPQFSQLTDHEAGMAWYRAIEATLKV
ncbi:MAG: glutathione S-transferase family protein [Candidatus Poseidoniaceae archaeon]|nr:glutathione S-transferase family protein [Candidatus Poseidoniaceae archaeon]